MLMLNETIGADNAMKKIETLALDYAAMRDHRCTLLREMEAEISRVRCSRLKSALTDRAVRKHMISSGLP